MKDEDGDEDEEDVDEDDSDDGMNVDICHEHRLDEEKMMTHILDCVAALAEKQRARVSQEKPLTLTPDGAALTLEQHDVLRLADVIEWARG